MAGGANLSCLIEAQQNYAKGGVSEPEMLQHVRPAVQVMSATGIGDLLIRPETILGIK
jgi:hypothetical protein